MHHQNTYKTSTSNIFFSRRTFNLVILFLLLASIFILSGCGGSKNKSSTNIGATTTDTTTGQINTDPTPAPPAPAPSNPDPVNVIAAPDTASTEKGIAVVIPVLSNDSGISNPAVVSIMSTPVNGTPTILADNTISYKPNPYFIGDDNFTYKVNVNGNIAIATVTVSVTCSQCSKDVVLGLKWNPSQSDNTTSDIGYLIYYGTNSNNTNTLLYDLSINTGLIPETPSVEFSASNDLQLTSGDNVCFRISAYNSNTTSQLSNPVCGVI